MGDRAGGIGQPGDDVARADAAAPAPQKKSLIATERDEAERAAWRGEIAALDPATFVFVSLGSGLANVVEEPGLAVLLRPSVLGPIIGLALLALIPVGYKHWRGKKPA